MAKERIAQITDASIGRVEVIGRDEFGRNIERTVPPCESGTYLDTAGSEVRCSLTNGRANTARSREKYGVPHHIQLIKDGNLPKYECPLTPVYRRIVGGPLVTWKREELANGVPGYAVDEDGHVYADPDSVLQVPPHECQIDDRAPPKHGCLHYQVIRERRRAESKREAKVRKMRVPTDAEASELAKSLKEAAASMAASMTAGRDGLALAQQAAAAKAKEKTR